jgi:molecular chaperone DnaK (HSP70)
VTYAIDFGTSNTVIARWNAATKQPETVKLAGFSQQIINNPPLIPSLAYIEDAETEKILVGQTVRDRGLDGGSDPRFFRGFKRGIGTKIQGFLPELDGQVISFEQVGNWYLSSLIGQLQQENQTDLESLILTVPVDSFESYRQWLSQTCQNWSIEQVRMLDEPTAAALGYNAIAADSLLVMDFGGGTVDFSLVQLNADNRKTKNQGFLLKLGDKFLGNSSGQKTKIARVLAKAGANLGGTDLDHWIADYFADRLPKSALATRLAERLKIQLSSQSVATEVYFNDQTFDSYELSLDQAIFKQILEDNHFFAQLDELMTQVLQQARRNGVEVGDIDGVLLVGGTSQIPAVQDWIGQYFDQTKIRSDRPFEAIAQGALQISQGIEVKDFLYHSYGVRYWNRRQNVHSWHPLIPSGQAYPMTTPIELTLGASVENQPSIELILGELGTNTGATEVYFEGDRLLTRSLDREQLTVQTLNDQAQSIAKLTPLGYPGSDRIKVQFWIDDQRFLRMTVEDLLTQQTLLENQIVTQLS